MLYLSKTFTLLTLLECILLLVQLRSPLHAQTTTSICSYYIDADAEDGGDGTTVSRSGEHAAWNAISDLTAATAAGAIDAGSTICFQRGDTWNLYNDDPLYIWMSGSSDLPIQYTWYGNAENTLPVFNGGKEFNTTAYQWTQSNGAATEFYLESSGGGPPAGLPAPLSGRATVAVKPVDATNPINYPTVYDEHESYYLLQNSSSVVDTRYDQVRLPGNLEDDMWAYGKNPRDNLTFETIYIRCDDGPPRDRFASIIISLYNEGPAIAIVDADYNIVHGLEVRNIGNFAVRILGHSNHNEISDVVGKFNYSGIDAWDAAPDNPDDPNYCFNTNHQEGNIVHDCYLTQNTLFGIAGFDCGSFNTIYDNECCYNHKFGIFSTSQYKTYIIESNDCHHNSLEMLNAQWAYWGIEVVQNAINHHPIIRYNKSHHNSKADKASCGDGGGINIRADNAEVYYNLCYANDGPGIGGEKMNEPMHYGAEIFNNVLYNNCQHAYAGCNELKLGVGANEFIVRNNILQRDPASRALYFISISDPSTLLSNNCYYSPDPNKYIFSFVNQAINSCRDWIAATDANGTSFCINPLLAYAPNSDFRIRFNSPCIDTGTDVGRTEDYHGTRVPYGSHSDIGAHEYIGEDYDGIPPDQDNCPNIPNGPALGTCVNMTSPSFFNKSCMIDSECGASGFCSLNQDDTIPQCSGGNGYGDACDCYGNFDNDSDVDGSDVSKMKRYFGMCINGELCKGDFNCDGDVDGSDLFMFRSNFGRSLTHNSCPLPINQL